MTRKTCYATAIGCSHGDGMAASEIGKEIRQTILLLTVLLTALPPLDTFIEQIYER
jgi:hypothetical protein